MSVVRVSAPGSLMLTGEHAVLHGYSACACAVDKRIFLKGELLNKRKLIIESALGNYEADLDSPVRSTDFTFITEAVRNFSPRYGIKISTESQFSHKTGLGSSAAVTVCICKALNLLYEKELSDSGLFRQALDVVRCVQKTGSGSDLAASVFGGIIKMDGKPSPLPCARFPEIDLYYSGYKMKTPEVIALVNKKAEADPEKYEMLYRKMGSVSEKTAIALEKGDFFLTGRLFDEYHALMEELGVCDDTLRTMTEALRKERNVLGAKISGSGLGDCVLSLGIPEKKPEGFLNIPVRITKEGICIC